MPILLVPGHYSDKTITVSLKEMDNVETDDKLVETTMGEVCFAESFLCSSY